MTKKVWFPRTSIGKKAIILFISTFIWLVLIPFIPFPQSFYNTPIMFILGPLPPLGLLILVISSLGLSYKAIFIEKDKSIIGFLLFVLLCLIFCFIAFFITGEILVSH